MRLIDDDGNLFGLVNIIDALALLLVVGISIAGVALVTPSDGTHQPGGNVSETVVIVRTTDVPGYVADTIADSPELVDEGAQLVGLSTINTSSGRVDLYTKVRLRATSNPQNQLVYKDTKLLLGRSLALEFRRTEISGTIFDVNATEQKLPTPTQNPSPEQKTREVTFVTTNQPEFVVEHITTGPVPTADAVAVTSVETTVNTGGNTTSYTATFRAEIPVRTTSNGLLTYNDQRLFVGRELRLDLGATIVKATVIDL